MEVAGKWAFRRGGDASHIWGFSDGFNSGRGTVLKVKLRAGTEEILLETLGRFGFYFPQGVPSPDPEEVDNG